ncbi:MAG: asparagine synthase-related protein, partial [Planctomycetes bacterium]|nr:asparagine synthase-related protein [Planctomycetota bacterium]
MNTRTAVAGVLSPEAGVPAPPGPAAILDALPWPGAGPARVHGEGPAALGARAAAGGAAAVALLPGAGLALAADLRLDNRGEILDALGVPGPERPGLSDADVVLRLWAARGERALDALEGDYALLLADGPRGRLLAARDAMGARPLYWTREGGRFAASTSARALAAAGAAAGRIDEARIAAFLVGVLELDDREGTFFEGVRRLLPGHLLEAGPGGVVVRRFRSLPVPAPGEPLLRGEEAREGLRAALRRSVGDRLGDGAGVGAMLSGGLDSSSIVGLGRDLLRGAGRPPLRTFSAVEGEGEEVVEGPWIRSVLGQGGVEPLLLLPGDAGAYLDEVRAAPAGFEEPFDGGVGPVPLLMMLAARRAGIGALLDGVDGDLALSLNEECIGHAAAEGRWGLAWSLSRGFAGFLGEGAAGLLWRRGIRPRAPGFLKRGWRRLRPPVSGWEEALARSPIHPDLARRTGVRERLRAMGEALSPPFGQGDGAALAHAAHRAGGPWLLPGVERYGRAAASLGLEARHPLADFRLASFGLRVHWEEKVRGGRRKALLAAAMEGVLPPLVRDRKAADQNLNVRFGEALLRARGEGLREEVQGALERTEGMVDKSFLEKE